MSSLSEEVTALAKECGFEHTGDLNAGAIILHPEVREMCASGKCHIYGTNWRCPPYCGTLEELGEKMKQYSCGVIVQSTGELEDDFDGEAMMETSENHQKRFLQLLHKVKNLTDDFLPLAAGTCPLCPSCTCPDEPCRHPEMSFSSMEACGMLVSEVCQQSDIPYYYGKLTITYTSCIMLP